MGASANPHVNKRHRGKLTEEHVTELLRHCAHCEEPL